ncbi:MAG: putative phage protein [Firmicutes bacterium]|nr:putative phage protein [Bacillota bacterium]
MAQVFSQKLYMSKAWIELRRNLIIERGPICQRCNTLMLDTSKLIGHHTERLTPQNVNDPNVALNPKKIELVCLTCHNQEPGHFAGQASRSVYLVYGAPCSGKSSMVNQLAERGDLILDIDKLFECVSGMSLYDKPDNLRFNVFALRDKMLDMIKTRYGKWHDAYVIGTYPNKAERDRLALELGAEVIYCEATKEECDATMRMRQLVGYERYIDRWFTEYQA